MVIMNFSLLYGLKLLTVIDNYRSVNLHLRVQIFVLTSNDASLQIVAQSFLSLCKLLNHDLSLSLLC